MEGDGRLWKATGAEQTRMGEEARGVEETREGEARAIVTFCCSLRIALYAPIPAPQADEIFCEGGGRRRKGDEMRWKAVESGGKRWKLVEGGGSFSPSGRSA